MVSIIHHSQTYGLTCIAAQHHYGVSREDARSALLRLLGSSGLVRPLNGRAVIQAFVETGRPGLFDRLVPQRNTRDLMDRLSPAFDVVFHDGECDSDLYELVFETISTVGLVHALCGIEMFDEVLGDLRARDAITGHAPPAPAGAPSAWSSRGRWRTLTESLAREAADDPGAIGEFRAGRSQEQLQTLADLLREPASEDLTRLADLLSGVH